MSDWNTAPGAKAVKPAPDAKAFSPSERFFDDLRLGKLKVVIQPMPSRDEPDSVEIYFAPRDGG